MIEMILSFLIIVKVDHSRLSACRLHTNTIKFFLIHFLDEDFKNFYLNNRIFDKFNWKFNMKDAAFAHIGDYTHIVIYLFFIHCDWTKVLIYWWKNHVCHWVYFIFIFLCILYFTKQDYWLENNNNLDNCINSSLGLTMNSDIYDFYWLTTLFRDPNSFD